jgi:hypothetical protein
MVLEIADLGGVEVGATVLAASQDVVAGFLSIQASRARVGVVGVDAVSNSADGCAADGEVLDP